MGGSYSVGRKDCTVVINTDKAVSRLHAELIIGEALPFNPLAQGEYIPRPSIKIRDKSKLGTFVNKQEGAAATPVLSLPGGEAILKDGDVVTFGTNTTTFRLGFLPIVLCIPTATAASKRRRAMEQAAAIGAYVVDSWQPQCTHLLVEDKVHLSPVVTAAVAAGRPLITLEWLQAFASRGSPDAPIPSPGRFPPTVLVREAEEREEGEGEDEGEPAAVLVAPPEARQLLFQGFTFLMGPPELYDENLQSLIEASGGAVESIIGASRRMPPSSQSVPQDIWVAPGGVAQEASMERRLSAQVRSFVCTLRHMAAPKLIGVVLAASRGWTHLLQAPDPGAQDAMSGSTDDTVDEPEPGAEIDSAATRTRVAGLPQQAMSGGTSQGWKSSRAAATQPRPDSEAGSPPIRAPNVAAGSVPAGSVAQVFSTSVSALPAPQSQLRQREPTAPDDRLAGARPGDRPASKSVPAGQGGEKWMQGQRESSGASSQWAPGFSRRANGAKTGGNGAQGPREVKDEVDAPTGEEGSRREAEAAEPRLGEGDKKEGTDVVGTAGEDGRFSTADEPLISSNAEVLYAPLVVTTGRLSRAAGAPESQRVLQRGDGNGALPNYKRFRKVGGGLTSGNSFATLVPFAKEPYRESDLAKEVEEYMQREKRRKATEAAAEDLFNADRLKRQRVAAGGAAGATVPPKPPRGRVR